MSKIGLEQKNQVLGKALCLYKEIIFTKRDLNKYEKDSPEYNVLKATLNRMHYRLGTLDTWMYHNAKSEHSKFKSKKESLQKEVSNLDKEKMVEILNDLYEKSKTLSYEDFKSCIDEINETQNNFLKRNMVDFGLPGLNKNRVSTCMEDTQRNLKEIIAKAAKL